jgi:hypothetical protein
MNAFGFLKGSNQTGHYELNLSMTAHRFMAVHLKDTVLEGGSTLAWRNIGCVIGLCSWLCIQGWLAKAVRCRAITLQKPKYENSKIVSRP